jgi:4-hydroxy-tetrahydrodipicolinate synthase
MKQVSKVISLCGKNFGVYSGDDFTTFTLYSLGGVGTISVTANVMPSARLHYLTDPLNYAMFIETNPIPVKTSLAMMGKVQEVMRLPLSKMSNDNKKKLRKVLRSYKLVR